MDQMDQKGKSFGQLIVDRLEGKYAVCEQTDGKMLSLLLSQLPEESGTAIFSRNETEDIRLTGPPHRNGRKIWMPNGGGCSADKTSKDTAGSRKASGRVICPFLVMRLVSN